jgi:hypothetical protein
LTLRRRIVEYLHGCFSARSKPECRRKKITYFSGFANGTDATVVVGHVNYVVQLKYENGEWRIDAASMK